MAKVKVHVFLKPGVLDVQGKAVEGALKGLGWAGVANARVGKLIELDLDGVDDPAAEAKKKIDDHATVSPVAPNRYGRTGMIAPEAKKQKLDTAAPRAEPTLS